MNSESKQLFVSLIRLGIGNTTAIWSPPIIDWKAMEDLASKQGLLAIMIDGIERLPEDKRPPKQILLEWIGEVLQGYEYRYEHYRRAIAELAGWYNSHGYKMMVLKGYACGLNWTRPEHRPCGDIDIWQFGQQKEADALLKKKKEIEIDTGHHHHTVFYWGEFLVENHYDFVNVHSHKSNRGVDKLLKELGQNDSYCIELYGEKVYLPSPNLHALFLLRHSSTEFAATGINFRQVIDWAFFVKNHGKEIDWEWLVCVLDRYHMKEFFNCINAICVEDLGFSSIIFPYVQFNPFLKDKVLEDILTFGLAEAIPPNIYNRVIWKYHRWKRNRWKHELCYNESMWSSFWHGVWSHIIKPSSI